MSNCSHNNKRLAKNTIYLYFRTFCIMCVSIFTSRVILDALGIEDYGIYNVVGGFVSMFSVLSGTLTAASQRFIAFELGKEKPQINKVFSTAITIHLILAICILILLESIGLWFLNNKMNITPERLYAANWVFQCSVITFFVSLICIPYNAAIIAYEKISAFAFISIFEVVCKLLAAYSLYIITFDSLIIYAIFMLIISLILRAIYSWYCNKYIKDCCCNFTFDNQIFKEMIGFSGWNFIGSTAGILNNQGINLLINLFFGVTVNAARGIANQVDGAINTFVQNFMIALNPQITKSYAARDFIYVNKMIIIGTKFAFFLFWILCLPVYINIDFLLSIWLKEVPQYAALFVKYSIIYTLCQNLSQCLYTTMLATGCIKKYQIIVGTLSLMSFPMTYLFFKIGLPSEYGYISIIIFSFLSLIARIFLLQEIVLQFSWHTFLKKALVPIIYTIIPTTTIIYYIHIFNKNISFESFLGESLTSILFCSITIYYCGLTKIERKYISNFIHNKIVKTKK